MSNELLWSRCDHAEYPPEHVEIWITDYVTVRRGTWSYGGPGIPLEESKWEDVNGNPIAVTEWLFIEESPDSPPRPPQSRPQCTGGIVGFETTRNDVPPDR